MTLHDFFVQDDEAPRRREFATARERTLVRELMATPVVTARPDQSIDELVGQFSDCGLHYLPVVSDTGAVLGMITQSDLVAALARECLEDRVGDAGGAATLSFAGRRQVA